MITLGISKVRDDGGYTTNEYRVFWLENGRYNEDKSSYHDDPEDAVGTLIATMARARELGYEVQITKAGYTLKLVAKYRPGFLISEARLALRSRGHDVVLDANQLGQHYESFEEV
ncbi:MAG: hypothetical protein ACXABY_34295 [Candidatus Thorarchaeota archaeon]|jgi:hypothetical protein